MSFRTTSTAMSPRRRLVKSVFPLRFDDEKDPLYLSFIMQHSEQRSLDHLLSGLNAAPRVEARLADRVVDLEGEIQHGLWLRNPRSCSVLQIVVQGTNCGLVSQLAWSIILRPGLDPTCQLRDALEVLFVLDSACLPRRDNLVEQSGHLVVIRRIGQLLMNDLASDVVLNGLRDGGLVPYASQSSSDRVCTATLHDQLYQAEIVERRDFSRLIGLDVGVN